MLLVADGNLRFFHAGSGTARHGTARHRAVPRRRGGDAMQCNAYGKFQRESGDRDAVQYRAGFGVSAPLG